MIWYRVIHSDRNFLQKLFLNKCVEFSILDQIFVVGGDNLLITVDNPGEISALNHHVVKCRDEIVSDEECDCNKVIDGPFEIICYIFLCEQEYL